MKSTKPIARNFDYAIIGSGASGLWLAIALAEKGLLVDKKLLMIEKNAIKNNDRTWCFWEKNRLHPILSESVSASWKWNEVNNQLKSLAPYSYHHIRSNDFYQKAKEYLNKFSNIHWCFDEVIDLEYQKTEVAIHGKRSMFSSKLVFNSCLNEAQSILKKQEILWQSFYGWRIKWLETLPENSNLKLMNYEIPQDKNCQFIYHLPFDNSSALVELTRFGKQQLNESYSKNLLSKYLENFNTPYEIEEVEIGKLPMTQLLDTKNKTHPKDEMIFPIGIAAGALKSTTGYAFIQMKNHAYLIVESLKNNTAIPKIYRKSKFRFYDSLLLDILDKEPSKGKQIFTSLFNKSKQSLIFDFLNEESNFFQEISIFRRLPIFLFLKYLLKKIII